eukprot:scaffold129692_cov18-Tisochrysis_lutea.AAC.1
MGAPAAPGPACAPLASGDVPLAAAARADVLGWLAAACTHACVYVWVCMRVGVCAFLTTAASTNRNPRLGFADQMLSA